MTQYRVGGTSSSWHYALKALATLHVTNAASLGCVGQAYEARRAARDAEREAQEAAQEAEIARAAEERRRREEEEAAKWMHLFSVEAAGEEALSKEQGEVRAARVYGRQATCHRTGT